MFPIFKLFVCFVIQCEPIRKNVLGLAVSYLSVFHYEPISWKSQLGRLCACQSTTNLIRKNI